MCQQPFVVRRPKFRHRRRSRPRGRRDYRNQWRSHREHRRGLTRGPSRKELVSSATGRDHSSRQRHQSPTAASRRKRRCLEADDRSGTKPGAWRPATTATPRMLKSFQPRSLGHSAAHFWILRRMQQSGGDDESAAARLNSGTVILAAAFSRGRRAKGREDSRRRRWGSGSRRGWPTAWGVGARCGLARAFQGPAVVIWWRWSLVRLWVAISNRHSVRTAVRPRR